jgi:hypothetical protein
MQDLPVQEWSGAGPNRQPSAIQAREKTMPLAVSSDQRAPDARRGWLAEGDVAVRVAVSGNNVGIVLRGQPKRPQNQFVLSIGHQTGNLR